MTRKIIKIAQRLRDEFKIGAVERDQNWQFPHDAVKALRASGLLGLMVPRKLGGLGGSFRDLMEVTMVLSEGDPNIGQMYQIHCGGIRLIEEIGESGIAAKLMRKAAKDGVFLSNAYSEIGTKTVLDYKTTVKRDRKGGWRINGTKYYCTGSLGGDYLFGPALLEGMPEQVYIFVAPARARGITIHDDWRAMGQRGTASGTIEFKNVHLDDELCLDLTANANPFSAVTLIYQAVHTGVFAGIARNAVDEAIEFVRSRARVWYEAGVERAAEDPYVLLRVGEMKAALHAAEALAFRAADYCDAAVKKPSTKTRGAASIATGEARVVAADAAMKISELLFKVCGTSSISGKNGFDRHWRNARALSLHNPLDYKLHHIGDFYVNGTLPPIDSYN